MVLRFSVTLCAAQPGPGPAGVLLNQARTYEEQGNRTAARTLLLRVVNEHAGSESELKAREQLVTSYVTDNQSDPARVHLQLMISRFSEHERLPHAFHGIAESCCTQGKGPSIQQFYLDGLADTSLQAGAIHLRMGLAIVLIHQEADEEAIEAVVEQIVTTHHQDPRIAEAFGQIAWYCRKLEQHDRARRFYRFVADQYGDKPRAIYSQRGIILSSLALEDMVEADAATQRLVDDFAANVDFIPIVISVAKAYAEASHPRQAQTLYQHLLDRYPQSEDRILWLRGMVYAALDNEDPAAAKAAVNQLLKQHASHQEVPRVACHVADKFFFSDLTEAERLYRYTVDHHPQHELAPVAQASLGGVYLLQGKKTAAEQLFQEVLSGPQTHSRYPEALNGVANAYWNRAVFDKREGRNKDMTENFNRTLAYLETLQQNFATQRPDLAVAACYRTAKLYQMFDQYDQMAQACERMATQWPEDERVPGLLFRIGKIHDRLKEMGEMPAQEAEPKVRRAFETIVENYPDSPFRHSAEQWLQNHLQAEEQDAAEGGQG
jgi:TolA-binding protein